MNDREMPSPDHLGPVIYIHAKGRAKISRSEAKALLEQGLQLCSRLAYEGWTQTVNGYDQPGLLMAELARSFPGRPVIFMRAGMRPDRQQLDELLEMAYAGDQPVALTVLSNADEMVNPFAGLQTSIPESEYDFAGLVRLLAPGEIHTLDQWCDHFTLFSAELVKRLAGHTHDGTMIQSIAAVGGSLKMSDRIFLADPANRVIAPLKLDPNETACPPPFGELSSRIQGWFDAGIEETPLAENAGQSATLHITHSWGGGVAEWVKSFIETDAGHQHYQLQSEQPQKNRSFGQRISLYAGNELRCPITSWWLNPAIPSVTDNHEEYREILTAICQRYGIGRILISSLIGHSLEVYRSGMPSLHILHDHFPLWPLLSVNPEPYLREGSTPDLETAMRDHKTKLEFTDKNADQWSQLGAAYVRTLEENHVKIAAPGKTVLDLQARMSAVFNRLETKIIPHGFPDMGKLKAISPRQRDDGRLRMIIPGRMQTGKGQELLAKALPELTKYVQVYLLGTGKPGHVFFGTPGVDVIVEYKRDELPGIVESIGPHFAALLSVVPETYSFTLSELQQMQIPTVATRLGSFPSRIEHDTTGWLIGAEAGALLKQVADLSENPEKIELVRKNLAGIRSNTPGQMLAAYNELCPPSESHIELNRDVPRLTEHQKAALAFEKAQLGNSLHKAVHRNTELLKEVDIRTEWAKDTGRQLDMEQKRRTEWVGLLEIEIDRLQQMVAERQASLQFTEGEFRLLEADYNYLEANLLQIQAEHQQLEVDLQHLEQSRQQIQGQYDQVSDQYATVLGSLSWKITKPLRASRRVLRNFKQARAWNPARWPYLISQLVRLLATQGVSGTLRRIQATTGVTHEPQPPIIKVKPQVAEVDIQADSRTKTDTETGIDTETKTDTDTSTDNKPEAGTEAKAEPAKAPLAFPLTKHPKASIVIPVYNKWAYTAACLCSLLEFKGKYSFEIIVVDDQSSDETADQLAKIEGLTHLRNETNLGFVGSCNRGAKHARGEYLVLLNNDTQVTAGWLDELIDTFDREPMAGMVGSRLVYPDGRLQESGGIIFNDASGWNYGREQASDNPIYHFLREVDYCSGACIALKTEYFHQIGALDERYAPAYYEDTDLAFKVRESGLKVFIQPASVIIHHEGVTSGTDTSSGIKKYQLINQKKFAERWKNELQLQPAPVDNPFEGPGIFRASQHRAKKRILIIDATTPEPDKDSGSVRLTNLMQCCRELGFAVTFFADNRAYAGKYTQDLQKSGIEVLYHPWLVSLHDFFRHRGAECDYIFISRHYIAVNYVSLIKRYAKQARFIFDTVDLHYLREQRLAELEQSKTLKRTAQQTKRSELVVIKEASATLVVSTVEKEVLAKDSPDAKVHILSNIHKVPGRDKGFAERKDIFFVGGYQHPPNVDAACWFVKDIWPLIHEQLPELRFHLIGSKAPDEIRALDGNGVVFHGFVESIDPFLNNCRLAVAPLRYGAGVKGKVNMSMAHGQPVVATPAAAEGMFAEHEREILIAKDAKDFASEVVRLYQDEALWNRISDASIKNVEEHFSLATARKNLVDLFDSFEG